MMELGVLAVLGVFALFVAWFLRPAAAFVGVVALGVLQIFLTSNFSVSVAAISQLAAWVTVFRHRASLPRLRLVGGAYIGLVGVSCVVLIWSSDRSSGLTLIAQLIGLGAAVSLGLISAVGAPVGLRAGTWVLAALASVSALSIILFRVYPDVEHAFFVSPAFGPLNSNDIAAHFFTTERNNVLDKAKSGGFFFVNANAASLFSGSAGAVLGGRAVMSTGWRRTLLALAAVTAFVGSLATGSKTAVYLSAAACLVLGLGAVSTQWRTPRRGGAVLFGVVALVAAVAVVALPIVGTAAPTHRPDAADSAPVTVAPSVAPVSSGTPDGTEVATSQTGLASQSADALGTRVEIWKIAAKVFRRTPLGTLGFGGWHDAYAPLAAPAGLNPAYPPHDWIIQTWSETGVIGLALIGLMLLAVARLWLRAFRSAEPPGRLALILCAIGLGWVLVHGLADNTGFYGGPRLIPVVALALATTVSIPRGLPAVSRRVPSAEYVCAGRGAE